ERRATTRPDDVLDEGWLLLFERGTHRGIAGRLLQVHHRGRGQSVRAPMHQRFGTGGFCLVLSASRRLVALGIDQKIVFVRLHAYASVELSCFEGRGRSFWLISLQLAPGVNAQR